MLTITILKSLLKYNPDTGLFTSISTNKTVGCFKSSYVIIGLQGKKYKAHRLAYFYMKGHWPIKCTIDHIDNNKHNNRWSNLQELWIEQNVYKSNKNCYYDSQEKVWCIHLPNKQGIMTKYTRKSKTAAIALTKRSKTTRWRIQ